MNRLKVEMACLILFLCCQRTAWAEDACDPPIPDAHGDVTFICHGLTDDQLRLLPKISTVLDKLLVHDVPGAGTDAQLDDILIMLQTGPKGVPKKAEHAKAVPEPVSGREIISYDYRGYKKSSLTGSMMGEEAESQVYLNLLTLQKAGDWKKLLKESSREIKRVPEWLTPYAFKAVALVHLGKEKEAISALEYVDKYSAGDSDYDQVRRMLTQLQTKAMHQ